MLNLPLNHPGAYHIADAHTCVYLSEVAYKDEADIRQRLEATAEECTFFDSAVAQCFIAVNGDDVMVAFRGTEYNNIVGFYRDWESNLRVQLVDFPGANNGSKVHGGFSTSVAAVQKDVMATLNKIIDKNKNARVWFTGHSLGGASSVIMAAIFAKQHPGKTAGVYTFGAPKVGNYTFTRDYAALGLNSITHRFENNNDLIPSAPFLLSSWFPQRAFTLFNAVPNLLGMTITSPAYYHVGTQHYINRNNEIIVEPDVVTRRIDYAVGGVTGGAILDKLLDHRHGEYHKAIRENNPASEAVPRIRDPFAMDSTCVLM